MKMKKKDKARRIVAIMIVLSFVFLALSSIVTYLTLT